MKQAQNINEVLERSGLSLPHLLNMLSIECLDSALFKLSDEEYAEYHRLFAIFDHSRSNKDNSKGVALENLASYLVSKIGFYNQLRNKRTSTNEIDILLVKKIGLQSFNNEILPNHLICECKNYGSSVSVTYIGKFYALLKVSGIKLGLMISDAKISGRSNWTAGNGLCRKIALRDDTYIVNISYDDLRMIDRYNIPTLKLIVDKINEIKLDIAINYDEHELCTDSTFTSMDSD